MTFLLAEAARMRCTLQVFVPPGVGGGRKVEMPLTLSKIPACSVGGGLPLTFFLLPSSLEVATAFFSSSVAAAAV
jgi:hypothetical protein